MKKIIVFIALVFLLTGCTANTEKSIDKQTETKTQEVTAAKTEEATAVITEQETPIDDKDTITNLMMLKIDALKAKDLDSYMTTISKSDEYYINEQKRWFTEMTKDGMKDYQFDVMEIEQKDENTIVATINQKHFYNAQFDITYPLKFVLEEGEWKDAGYDFLVYEGEGFTIKYMEGETKVEAFADLVEKAYKNLAEVFEEKPDENFQIKLFHDREMLRQRSIPSIGWLFTGWGEANESLKIYTGHEEIEQYLGTLQHEIVHHITMRICNNNLPGWLADGVALEYGSYLQSGGNAITNKTATKEQLVGDFDFLENADGLWEATEQSQTWSWYDTAHMYTYFIIEKYGHDKLMDMFYEAGKKPYNENVMNPNFEKQNAETMSEVLEKVLGQTKEEFYNEYIEWLNENY